MIWSKRVLSLAAILFVAFCSLVAHSAAPSLEVVDISFVDEFHGWVLVMGQQPGVFRTTDGGQSWLRLPMPPNVSFYRLHFIDLNTGVAIQMESEKVTAIYRTVDAAQTWSKVSTIEAQYGEHVLGLMLTSPNDGFAVGEGTVGRGYVGQLEDGGRTVRRRGDLPVNFSGQSNALGVFGDGAGHLWIVGKEFILHSADSGKTWENQYLNTTPRIDMGLAGSALPGGHAWIAVANFAIYRTDDYGKHWDRALTTVHDTHVNFESISFYNIRQGCAVGNSSLIYCTEDGGVTWSQAPAFQSFPSGSPFFSKLLLFSSSHGWASINGALYRTEDGGHAFKEVLTSSGPIESGVPGETKALETPINGPTHLAYDTEGYLYIIEFAQQRLLRLDLKHESIKVLTSEPKRMDFGYPNAVVSDQHGIVYIADFNGQLRKLDTRTDEISVLMPRPARPIDSQLENPEEMAIDKDGNVLVAGSQHHKVLRWQVAPGKLEVVVGSRPGFGGDGGLATAAMLHFPMGVAVDQSGSTFISDYQSCRIRKIDYGMNTISTIAGTGECVSNGDGGAAISAAVNYPTAIVLDRSGNLFFAEGTRVRRIDQNGVITTYVGTGQNGSTGDGGPADKATVSVSGIALDFEGNLYISEFSFNRVRRVDVVTHIITTIAGNGKPMRVDSVM